MNFANFWCRLVPGIKWLNGYSSQDAFADLIAGITVGLTVIPQALAYATLAGLEPQYGLYSAIMGGIIYAFFGSCRQVTIGPTALLALITSRHTSFGLNSSVDYARLLCLISGLVELGFAILRLGGLVDLISLPVSVGFTTATAVIIATSQLKGLLGLRGKSDAGFLNTSSFVFRNLQQIRLGDTLLGLFALVALVLLKKLKDVKLNSKYKWFRIFLWSLVTGRNALIILMASLFAYYSCGDQMDDIDCPFILTHNVKSGLPDIVWPKFETKIIAANGTEIIQNYRDMLSELGTSILVLPIIAILGNVAISKAFGNANLSPVRELVALSLSNIFGAFCSSMPVTGSFSRSAVNHASGVRTPIGGFYTSALVLLALGLLTPYFQYIPKAALSAVIIAAVIFMIEFEIVKPLWRCSRRELLPGIITFIVSLLVSVEFGILLGVATDLSFIVYHIARPNLNILLLETCNGIWYLHIYTKNSLLYFPSIEWLRSKVSKALRKHGILPVVLDCSNVYDIDFTTARGIGALHKDLLSENVPLFLLKLSNEIQSILKGSTNLNFSTIEHINELDTLIEQDKDPHTKVLVPLLNSHSTLLLKTIRHNDEGKIANDKSLS